MVLEAQMSSLEDQLSLLSNQIVELGRSDLTVDQYFRGFLDRVVGVLGQGGAIWEINDLGGVTGVCYMNLAAAEMENGGRQYDLCMRGVTKVFETGTPIVLAGKQQSDVHDGGLGEAGVNDSPYTLLFLPIKVLDEVKAVMLLISPEGVDSRAVRGYLNYVASLCERASAFMQIKHIDEMNDEIRRSGRLREYVSALHCCLDPRRVCYAMANYSQELLGVYRCMAGTFNSRGKFRMESVSGLESVAAKSNFIQSIATIAEMVCKNDEALLVEQPELANDTRHAEDDLVTAARLYMLQAETRVMGIFPVRHDGLVVGALVVEQAKDIPLDSGLRKKVDSLLAEAGGALANSLAYRNLPLGVISRPLGSLRDKIYRMGWVHRALWAALLLVIFVLPLVIKTQVKVVGTAELSPLESRIAYALQDGQIEVVSIPEDRKVEAGQVLASLDTRTIDSQIERVTNQIAETSIALEAAKQRPGQSAQAAQMGHRLEALRAELSMYGQMRLEHQITAPVAGMVITRESKVRQLWSRPVQRGEAILEVVPAEPQWELVVNIPETQAGELLRAYDKLEPGQRLRARMILNAYPGRKLYSEVLSVSRRAHVQNTGQNEFRNVIEVHVAAPAELEEVVDAREGLEGKVAIECGEHNLWYAVTHEFADFMRVVMF